MLLPTCSLVIFIYGRISNKILKLKIGSVINHYREKNKKPYKDHSLYISLITVSTLIRSEKNKKLGTEMYIKCIMFWN